MSQGREKNRYDVLLKGGPLDGGRRFVLSQSQPTALFVVGIDRSAGPDVAVPLAPPEPGAGHYELTEGTDDERRVYRWRD